VARKKAVLVTTRDGESFPVSSADDFDTEVELHRHSPTLLAMLDEAKKDDMIPLAEVEAKLR